MRIGGGAVPAIDLKTVAQLTQWLIRCYYFTGSQSTEQKQVCGPVSIKTT
jgi:hypothetical protein